MKLSHEEEILVVRDRLRKLVGEKKPCTHPEDLREPWRTASTAGWKCLDCGHEKEIES